MRLAVAPRSAGLALLLTLAAGAGASSAAQQGGTELTRAMQEIQLLRQEEQLESSGQFAAAEQVLRQILDRNPGSLSALIALDRLLRIQRRSEDVIPAIRAMLAIDRTSPIANQMLVRTYSFLNKPDSVQVAGDAWIEATPGLETPYREVARVWEQRGEYARAAQVLERGRKRLKRPDALALELGDAYALQGDDARAAHEWQAAVGEDGRGFMLVQRRIAGLPDGGANVLPGLIDLLMKKPTSPARQRAAASLAMDAGLEPRATAIAREVAGTLDQRARGGFLIEVARKADGAGLQRLAYWAYGQLAQAGGPPERLLAIRSRVAELALALGDTARAAQSYQALEKESAAGSPQRRQAMALRIELAAHAGKADEAASSLATFRTEYPDAPETDELCGSVAEAFLAKADLTRAEQSISGVNGPRSSLVAGRVALRRGDLAKARKALTAAAAGISGTEGTETVALLNVVSQLSPAGGDLLGRALGEAAAGQKVDAVALLVDGSAKLDDAERAAVLDYAAGLADRAELPELAERARRLIITSYPKALEAPAALLALGRALAERPTTVAEARQLLERLIVDYPRSALAPEARHELDLVQGRIPRS